MAQIEVEKLLAAAGAVRKRAYAPYSHFAVGAAALGDDGRVYAAVNVENASYGLSLCAERAAVAAAVAGGASKILAVAVVAGRPAAPCGACLQVIAELGPEAVVVWEDGAGGYEAKDVGELLPKPFGFGEGTAE
jgi:cytidine deaminase